jgi:hypothetical protein
MERFGIFKLDMVIGLVMKQRYNIKLNRYNSMIQSGDTMINIDLKDLKMATPIANG